MGGQGRQLPTQGLADQFNQRGQIVPPALLLAHPRFPSPTDVKRLFWYFKFIFKNIILIPFKIPIYISTRYELSPWLMAIKGYFGVKCDKNRVKIF